MIAHLDPAQQSLMGDFMLVLVLVLVLVIDSTNHLLIAVSLPRSCFVLHRPCVGAAYLIITLVAGLTAELAQAGGMKIEIAERERHFRAGEIMTRTVRLGNDTATTHTVRLAWTAAIPPAVLETGTLAALVPPRERVVLPLQLCLPPVRRTVQMQLVLSAEREAEECAEIMDWVRVYPGRLGLPWAFLAARRIGVLDPEGTLVARLRALGARLEIQLSPRDAEDFSGDLLVVGEDCFKSVAEWTRWREGLRRGGTGTSALVLHQAFAADPGGVKGAGVWAEPELTAAGRALLRELDPADLAGWRCGGAVRGPWIPLPSGKYLSLLQPAGMGNPNEPGVPASALLVEPLGPGRVLVRCQAPLLARWDAEPACELLLNALLRNALSGAFFIKRD